MAFNIEDILRDFSSIKCININTKTGKVLLFYDLYYIDDEVSYLHHQLKYII
ncbi:hypothetical protein [Clostridium sp.]|uniref:hypothetical protein n=1 Tax=Clostridium sp. TaxID=1506 RepID=UPI00345CEBFF